MNNLRNVASADLRVRQRTEQDIMAEQELHRLVLTQLIHVLHTLLSFMEKSFPELENLITKYMNFTKSMATCY